MSITETVCPSIEDPGFHTTVRSMLLSTNSRYIFPSPDTERLSEVFPGVDIENVRAINAEQMREFVKRSSKRLARHSRWFCHKRGLSNLFKDIDLHDTEEIFESDVRLYRKTSYEQGAQHVLEWGEQKGNNIMVVSRQTGAVVERVGQKRLKICTRPLRHIRETINQRMEEVERGRGEVARAFHVIRVNDTSRETAWHLIRKHPGTCIRIHT